MTAAEIRIQWMREMGITEDEIHESLEYDPPVSVEVEQAELDAIPKVRELNKKIDWDALKRRIDNIKKKNNVPENTTCIVCMKCEKIVQFDEEGNGYCDHFDERPNHDELQKMQKEL